MEWQSLRIVGLAEAGIRAAREPGRFSVTFALSERPSSDWRAMWERRFKGPDAFLKLSPVISMTLSHDGTIAALIARGAELSAVLDEVRKAVVAVNLEVDAAAHAAATQAAQEAVARDRELARLREQVARLQF